MSILLVGFMGAGKSTIGKELANELTLPFIDLDEQIVADTSKDIPTIFSTEGERVFREYEFNSLKNSLKKQQVIATGGGIITHKKSYDLLIQSFPVFFLKAPFPVLLERIKRDTKNQRPLADDTNQEALKTRFESRLSRYEKVSDFQIDTDGYSKDEIIKQMIQLL